MLRSLDRIRIRVPAITRRAGSATAVTITSLALLGALAGCKTVGTQGALVTEPERNSLRGFAVDLSHDFVGKEALDPNSPSRRRLFTTLSRRIPRAGQALVDGEGIRIGRVTSGSFSPVRSEGIGMGLVDRESDTLAIDMRGTLVPVELVSRRFI